MRTELTADGRLVEHLDITHCSGCGEPFARRLATKSWANCSCTRGVRGHRVVTCLRGTCRAETFDPPCTTRDRHNPLEGHDHSDPWAEVAWGPSLDVGEG